MSFSSSKLSARLSNPYLLEAVILILLLLTTVFINLRMIRDGINGMTDQRWHILWIQHFSKQMAEGIWYPRWLAGTNYGYGSPTFVFYPPLVYYLGSFFRFIGLNIQQTVTALFSLAIFLSGLNFYIYGRSRWGAIPATVGALVYMSAPYLAFNMYWIGSLSVAFAIPWIPLIWWLTEKAIAQPSWRIGLALSWTILALTHLPSLLLCGIVWLFHTLFFLLDRPWQSVVATLITAGIGLGIASFFLLPAIVEQPLVNIEAMASVGGGFQKIMLGGSRLPLIPLRFDLFIPQLFVQQLFAIATFGAIFFFFLRRDKAIAPEARYWLIFALVLAFLMTSWSWPIWKASSTLQKVQAPWRLLHLFSFFGAALSAVLVTNILKLRSPLRLLLSLIIVGILLTNLGYAYKLSHNHPLSSLRAQALRPYSAPGAPPRETKKS